MDGWMASGARCWEDFVELLFHNFLRGCASCMLRRIAAARTANLPTIVGVIRNSTGTSGRELVGLYDAALVVLQYKINNVFPLVTVLLGGGV